MENGSKVNKINISEKIPRYPLNGHSNYLIDKFYIFGYDSSTLKKYLLNNDNNLKHFLGEKRQNDEIFQKFNLEEVPTLLNEFTSDYEKECLEIDMIREMILPKKITLYYTEEDKIFSRSPEKRRKRDSNSSTNRSTEFSKVDKNEENFYIYEDDSFYRREVPPSYNVIFSSNPQSGNNSKKSINGFAYIFYKKLKEKKELNRNINISFFIPIIFCIISEYPFYNSFYHLSMQIEYLFSNNELRIPIEIILYNLINLSPSPLNGDVFLSLKSITNFDMEGKTNTNVHANTNKIIVNETIEETNEDLENNNENINITNKINKNKKDTSMNYQNLNMNKNISLKRTSDLKLSFRLSNINNSNVLKHLKTISTSDNYKYNTSIKNVNYGEKLKKIKFDKLTGYPIIQYNLAKLLLQTLTPLDVIDIFLYTFLEKDVIFFSKDIEFLSLTINSYLNLNFPLNDEKYYFINACVSYDNYINGNSTFVGSTFTTIIGINDSYNPKYQAGMNKLKEHLAVDLDNGKVYKVEDKSDKEKSKKNKELFNCIKNACKNKESKNDKKILYREIFILNRVLTDIYNRMNDKEDEKYYNIYKYNKYIDYSDDNIKSLNLLIQDSFYRFINNLCLYVYQNLCIKTEGDDMKMKSRSKSNSKINSDTEQEMNVLFLDEYKTEEIYSKEELYLIEELTETMKFQSFVYGFVQSYNPIDLYKIPLTFTEEFISIIARKSSILERKINFLSLIDKLYKMNSGEVENIELNFEEFSNEYYSNYKNYFDREMQDICEENKLHSDKIKIKNYNINNKIILKYKSYELDNRILMKYMHILNTLENEENIIEKKNNNNFNNKDKDANDNVYLSSKKKVKENIPKNISVTDIETVIENYAIEVGILSESDLCSANIIILFTLSFRKLRANIECQSFLGTLFQDFTIFRKYYSMIMSMTYNVYEESMAKKDYNKAKDCYLLYYLCLNSLRYVKLIPNESLMNIIKTFNKSNINTIINTIDSKKEKDKNTPGENNEEKNNVNKNKNKKLYGVNLPMADITYKNLYVTHNFNAYKVYKEREVVEKINDPINSNKFFASIDGNELMQPKIKFNNGIHTFNSFFYSQKLLLLTLVEEYQSFIKDSNEEKLRPKIILDACLNIFVFMRNSKDFTSKSDIIGMVKEIFYIFLNNFYAIDLEK